MPRITVESERLWYRILSAANLDTARLVQVKPEVESDTLNFHKLPALLFNCRNGHMISNGNWQLGWEWDLNLILFVNDHDLGSDLADELYQLVHNSEGTEIDGVGMVSSVEDQSMFERSPSADTGAALITPYLATFTVRLRPPRAYANN